MRRKYKNKNKHEKASRPIKVLFINMVNPTSEVENLYPPLGPAYLVAYIKRHLGTERFIFQMISDNFENKITEIHPDIVAITCVSQNYALAKSLAQFAKRIGILYVMIGGSHISLYPMSLDLNINIGIVGEGEKTFLELLKLFISKRVFDPADLLKINGLVYHQNGEIVITPHRELISNLDDFPLPDRSLFKIDPNKAYMFSSRGCPYRCIFCASSRLWERTRFHSADYVLREIKELVEKFGVKKIDFYDDLFIADKQRVKDLVQLIKKEGIEKKVQFNVSARANLVNDEICLLLKEMNVRGMSMGLESGSSEILTYLKGENVTVEDNFRAVEIIKKHGLYCSGSFVIGCPIETRETILETLNFIKKSKLDEFTVYVLTPFPGTPIWDYAVEQKLVSSDPNEIDWSIIDVEYWRSHKYNIHLAKNLTREELYGLYLLFAREIKKRNIFRAFELLFTDPARFLYHVKKRLTRFFSLFFQAK